MAGVDAADGALRSRVAGRTRDASSRRMSNTRAATRSGSSHPSRPSRSSTRRPTALSRSAAPGRSTASRSGSSSTPTATWRVSPRWPRRCGTQGWWRWSRRIAVARSTTAPRCSVSSTPPGPASTTRSCWLVHQLPPRTRYRDAKAGAVADTSLDPRVELLLDEALRHGKPVGAYGAGVAALEGPGASEVPGAVTGADGASVLATW